MPKLRMTAEEIRERACNRAVARCRVDEGLGKDSQLADKLGIATSTLSNRKHSLYRAYGFEKAGAFARCLKMTGREVCAILGVPYEDPKDD